MLLLYKTVSDGDILASELPSCQGVDHIWNVLLVAEAPSPLGRFMIRDDFRTRFGSLTFRAFGVSIFKSLVNGKVCGYFDGGCEDQAVGTW